MDTTAIRDHIESNNIQEALIKLEAAEPAAKVSDAARLEMLLLCWKIYEKLKGTAKESSTRLIKKKEQKDTELQRVNNLAARLFGDDLTIDNGLVEAVENAATQEDPARKIFFKLSRISSNIEQFRPWLSEKSAILNRDAGEYTRAKKAFGHLAHRYELQVRGVEDAAKKTEELMTCQHYIAQYVEMLAKPKCETEDNDYLSAKRWYGQLAGHYLNLADVVDDPVKKKELFNLYVSAKALSAQMAIHPNRSVKARAYHDAAALYGSLADTCKNHATAIEMDSTEKERLFDLYAEYRRLAAETAIHSNCPVESRDYNEAQRSYGQLAHHYRVRANNEEDSTKKKALLAHAAEFHELSGDTEINLDNRPNTNAYGGARHSYEQAIDFLLDSATEKSSVERVITKMLALPKKVLTPRYVAVIGGFYRRLGDFDKASEYIEQALEAEPNSDRAYYERGLLNRDQGDLFGAFIDINRAVELSANSGDSEWQETFAALCAQVITQLRTQINRTGHFSAR